MGPNTRIDRAAKFETTFENKCLAFQLHCRGIQALHQARRRRTTPGTHPRPKSDASEAVGASYVSASDTVLDLPIYDPERQAEAYLLNTRGAELAKILTARECEKLVGI